MALKAKRWNAGEQERSRKMEGMTAMVWGGCKDEGGV